ncbi:MAG: DUF4340 domain-containing protein, partial [Candidatus Dadabacteria bacterium]|nr:DUF4340 domain-containing protein [Candidatus Dadabacteria bacterium]
MSDIIKKFSSTAIALVILIVAGAYYLVFEKGLEEKHKKESRLFSKLIKNDISSIRLTYPDSSIVLSKQAENWFLVKRGKTYKADGFTVSTIVDAVVDLKAESDVSKDDDDLAQYGLESPRVRLGATAGGDVYSVSIGAESPV